jgi:hypothetical protein
MVRFLGVTSTVLGCGDDGGGRGAGADVEQRAQHAGRRAGHVVDGEAHHQQPHPLCAPHRLLPPGLHRLASKFPNPTLHPLILTISFMLAHPIEPSMLIKREVWHCSLLPWHISADLRWSLAASRIQAELDNSLCCCR